MAFGDRAVVVHTFDDLSNLALDPFHQGRTAGTSTGGQFKSATGAAASEYWYSAATFGPNVEAYIEIPNRGGGTATTRILARVVQPSSSVNTGDGYGVQFVDNAGGTANWYILRFDNATATVVTSGTVAASASNPLSLGISCSGSTITAYLKDGGAWTSIGSTTDATYSAAGYIGFYTDSTAGEADRWDNLAAAGGSPALRPAGARPWSGLYTR